MAFITRRQKNSFLLQDKEVDYYSGSHISN